MMKNGNRAFKILRYVSLLTVLIFGLITIVGTGDNGGGPKSSTISGNAAKGPISGGTVQLFYFDSTGGEVEIIADNAPVTTDSSGAYSFEIDPANLEGITSPLIIRVTDDTNGQPQLEAVIADPTTLSSGGSTVTAHLSVASSVAAGLLKKQALQAGAAPSTDDANACIAQVENELDVDLTDDPGIQGTGVAYFNELVDLNLNLPENNNAVDDLINYLVANLSSTSGALDNSMDDPENPGTDIAAAFSGDLATLLSGGPSGFRILDFEADKTSLGNNGTDSVALTASLGDINGNPLPGYAINLTEESGSIVFCDAAPVTDANGQAFSTVTTTAIAGSATVLASYLLPNGNTLSEQITLTIADCQDVSGITIASDKATIIGDGVEAAMITANVSAVCEGSTVPEGTIVDFSIIDGDGGTISDVTTTTNGQATATLIGTQVDTLTVQASATSSDGTLFTETVDVIIIADPCDPAAPTVAADPPAIIVGGTSTITAEVPVADKTKCATSIVADGTVVSFAVTAGDGTVSNATGTTTDGIATVDLTAGNTVGTVTVTASVTDSQGNTHSGTVDVTVMADPCDPGAITLAANPSAIGTDGTSTITATVTASDPGTCTAGVADGTTVTFSATGGGTVSPAEATTTGGEATTTLTAPSSVGTVTVTATVDSISDSVDVSVASLPNTTTVTVSLTGVAAGTTLGGLDLTIDYDEAKVSFNSAVAGALTTGATVIPNDNGDTVRIGLIQANGFDGGASGSIIVLTFDVIQPNIPTASDLPVSEFSATDLMGADVGLEASNISLGVVNE
jgi:hypothetical protein